MATQTARPPRETPSDLSPEAVSAIAGALNALLADAFALYIKTKNFHWHVSGPHFRDYHELFDEQAAQILAMTDGIAERLRKIGAGTIRSTGQIAKLQRLKNNEDEFVAPADMLRELMADNKALVAAMREAHEVCDTYDDVATESLLEIWIDEAQKRAWFLFEASRTGAG